MSDNSCKKTVLSEPDAEVKSHIAWYHQMHETQPVRYHAEYNLWEVFRYKDAQQVLFNHATFAVKANLPQNFPCLLAKTDPPYSRQPRGLVSKAFARRHLEELTPGLIEDVDGLLKGATTTGKMDVAAELANQLPLRIVARILGLPLEDQERFQQWSYRLLRLTIGIGDPYNDELIQYFSDLFNERKCDPGDDLISELLATEENRVYLTREEMLNMCVELVLSRNITASIFLSPMLLRCNQRH